MTEFHKKYLGPDAEATPGEVHFALSTNSCDASLKYSIIRNSQLKLQRSLMIWRLAQVLRMPVHGKSSKTFSTKFMHEE
jgi:hypothetical protein